jgi:hypothetical protein
MAPANQSRLSAESEPPQLFWTARLRAGQRLRARATPCSKVAWQVAIGERGLVVVDGRGGGREKGIVWLLTRTGGRAAGHNLGAVMGNRGCGGLLSLVGGRESQAVRVGWRGGC